jgi:hypothetical protein
MALTGAQEKEIRELMAGQTLGAARLLPNGDVGVRTSGHRGRFELVVAPDGETSLVDSLPPVEGVRLAHWTRLLAGAAAVASLLVLLIFSRAGLRPVLVLPVALPAVALFLVGRQGEEWFVSNDHFLRPEPGRKHRRAQEVRSEWTLVPDGILRGDADGDGHDDDDDDGD